MATERTAFYTDLPGVEQSRVENLKNYSAPDGDAVLCLGSDQKGHQRLFKVGDSISYSQTADRDALENIVKIQSRIRGSSKLPIVSTITEPFNLVNGDNINILLNDSLIPQNVIFSDGNYGSPAVILSANSEPFTTVPGDNLVIEVNGTPNDIIFGEADVTTAENVADVINEQISGAYATVYGSSGKIRLVTSAKGSSETLEITGGTAAAIFNFPGGVNSGSGDISSALAYEVVQQINEQTTGLLAESTDEGEIVINSNRVGRKNKVTIISGTAQSKFNFVQLAWKFTLFADSVEQFSITFGPGREKDLLDLGSHLSNIGPNSIELSFELKLVTI